MDTIIIVIIMKYIRWKEVEVNQNQKPKRRIRIRNKCLRCDDDFRYINEY